MWGVKSNKRGHESPHATLDYLYVNVYRTIKLLNIVSFMEISGQERGQLKVIGLHICHQDTKSYTCYVGRLYLTPLLYQTKYPAVTILYSTYYINIRKHTSRDYGWNRNLLHSQ